MSRGGCISKKRKHPGSGQDASSRFRFFLRRGAELRFGTESNPSQYVLDLLRRGAAAVIIMYTDLRIPDFLFQYDSHLEAPPAYIYAPFWLFLHLPWKKQRWKKDCFRWRVVV